MKIVLLIDDSESYRFLLQEELSEEGYEVIPAGSIEEVFSKFKRAKPDMLVLEVRQQDVKEELIRGIQGGEKNHAAHC